MYYQLKNCLVARLSLKRPDLTTKNHCFLKVIDFDSKEVNVVLKYGE